MEANKRDPFDGRRDFLVVKSWIYKMEQYLVFVQLGTASVALIDVTRATCASTFFGGTAVVWWYTVVQTKNVPTS